MQGLSSSPDYMPLPGYQVIEFCEDSFVCLSDSAGNQKELQIAAAAVLIGSQPDLSFLPPKLRNLGIDVNKPVDCKANPLMIEPFSYRCVRAPPGLYALGPLVGDNFVRFLQGGAIAIASHIYKENSLHRDLWDIEELRDHWKLRSNKLYTTCNINWEAASISLFNFKWL